MKYFVLIAAIWNVVIFMLYGIDKGRARAHLFRISEATLILPAFFLASLGAMLGMIVFNHKTSKTKFRILIPLSFVINIICVIVIKKWAVL